MHYFAAVVVQPPDRNTVEIDPVPWDEGYFQSSIKQAMGPYDENLEVDEHWESLEDWEGSSLEDLLADARKWAKDPANQHRPEISLDTDIDVIRWYTGIEDWSLRDGDWGHLVRSNPQSKWDWWQIGGRWSGVWSDYDPAKDPANNERCWLCEGTGVRRVGEPGCNGCEGTGQRLKWPTDWARHEGDVMSVDAFLGNLHAYSGPRFRLPYALVIPGGWYESESRNRDDHAGDERWRQTVMAALEPFRNGAIVVVDYHS